MILATIGSGEAKLMLKVRAHVGHARLATAPHSFHAVRFKCLKGASGGTNVVAECDEVRTSL